MIKTQPTKKKICLDCIYLSCNSFGGHFGTQYICDHQNTRDQHEPEYYEADNCKYYKEKAHD